MIKIFGHTIDPTIFPDKTSQVWKLPNEVMNLIGETSDITIHWDFDHEAELIHLIQLSYLISSVKQVMGQSYTTTVSMSYLPYARQDKIATNETTFALRPFLMIMSNFFSGIIVFDAHNHDILHEFSRITGGAFSVTCIEPEGPINLAIRNSESTVVCFPDKGASTRYKFLEDKPAIVMDKVRDQLTGEITGLEIVEGSEFIEDNRILIVDDLCDGGRTFIETAKVLIAAGSSCVSLYVSHGIFSKGVQVLTDAGIENIYIGTDCIGE